MASTAAKNNIETTTLLAIHTHLDSFFHGNKRGASGNARMKRAEGNAWTIKIQHNNQPRHSKQTLTIGRSNSNLVGMSTSAPSSSSSSLLDCHRTK